MRERDIDSRYVIFNEQGEPHLLIDDAEFDEAGRIIDGFVVNGAWYLHQVSGAMDPSLVIREVPADWRGDYNEILGRAKELLYA